MTIHKFNENKNNVTVVGSPTINGNTVSGFTNSNYCQTPSNIAIGTSNYEVVVCFKITSSPSNYQELISLNFGLAISVNSEMKPHHNVGNGTGWLTGITGDTALSLNTKYYLKAVRSSGVSKLYVSTDGILYTEVGSLSNTTNIPTNIYGLGKKINSAEYGQYATLYLDKCYIKVGGSVVWKGVGAYEKIKDVYYGRAGTGYKRNIEVSGSPTFNKADVSGFANGVIYVPETSTLSQGSWTKSTELTTGSDVTTNQEIWISDSVCGTTMNLYDGKLMIWGSSNNSNYNLFDSISSTLTLKPNTRYRIDYNFNKEVGYYSVDVLGGEYTELTNFIVVNNANAVTDQKIKIGGGGKRFKGTVHLDTCYVKTTLNGSVHYWYGVLENSRNYDYVVTDSGVHFERIKKVYKENTLVYQALDDWEIPYRLDGCTWSSSNWNNNDDIPLIFDKNLDTRCGSGGGNGNYNVRTISINLPYYVYIERGRMVNGVPDRNGVGLCNNFQIWTNSGKGTPLTNYESISRSSKAVKDFNSINTTVKTNTLYFEIRGDGWTGCTEIYLYGKRVLD